MPRIPNLLIEIYCDSGDHVKATSMINNMIREQGRSAEVFYYKGLLSLSQGNLDTAKKLYKQGLQCDPDDERIKKAFKNVRRVENVRQAGNTLYKAGEYQEAYDKYTEGLELEKCSEQMNSVLYSNRAQSLIKLNKNKDALRDLTAAIKSNKKFIKAYLKRASLLQAMEEFDRAVADYHAVKEINPHYPDIEKFLKTARQQSKKAKNKDLYKVLGVDKKAGASAIKKAYFKLARIHHPDKNGTRTEDEKVTPTNFDPSFLCL